MAANAEPNLFPSDALLDFICAEFTRLRDGTADYGLRSTYSRFLDLIEDTRFAILWVRRDGGEGQKIVPENY